MHLRRHAVALMSVATVLALTGCVPAASAAVPAAARAAGVARAITVSGQSVPFIGLQSWTSASIPALSSRSLTVFAVGSADASSDSEVGGACGPPAIRLHTVETAGTVTVLVAEYELPSQPNQVCPAVGYGPGPHVVRLSRPLGSRALSSGAGKAVHLLDGQRYPDIPTAPASWGPSLLEGEFPSYPAGVVTRRWSLDAKRDRAVYLESEPPKEVRLAPPVGTIVVRTMLHGAPTTVYRNPGDGYLVQWVPNPTQAVTLHLQGTGKNGWTAADAVRWARAVTGYRTQPSDRLAQPTTPGTVEATFNSADGPVNGMLELLESSTVYVGLDCQGAGTVQVTVRGAIEPFACTAALSHHVAARHGVPHLQFPVTVHAGRGVRWALTLAVATLDGS